MHEHVWEIDSDYPVLDVDPPIYSVKCECGARAQSWGDRISDVRIPA